MKLSTALFSGSLLVGLFLVITEDYPPPDWIQWTLTLGMLLLFMLGCFALDEEGDDNG